MRRNFFSASKSPVAVQRSGCFPSRQRFTFRATRCTVDRHDSIGLVVASFRRNTAPTPKRCTVSVSSKPSSKHRAAVGLIRSSCRKIFRLPNLPVNAPPHLLQAMTQQVSRSDYPHLHSACIMPLDQRLKDKSNWLPAHRRCLRLPKQISRHQEQTIERPSGGADL